MAKYINIGIVFSYEITFSLWSGFYIDDYSLFWNLFCFTLTHSIFPFELTWRSFPIFLINPYLFLYWRYLLKAMYSWVCFFFSFTQSDRLCLLIWVFGLHRLNRTSSMLEFESTFLSFIFYLLHLVFFSPPHCLPMWGQSTLMIPLHLLSSY